MSQTEIYVNNILTFIAYSEVENQHTNVGLTCSRRTGAVKKEIIHRDQTLHSSTTCITVINETASPGIGLKRTHTFDNQHNL